MSSQSCEYETTNLYININQARWPSGLRRQTQDTILSTKSGSHSGSGNRAWVQIPFLSSTFCIFYRLILPEHIFTMLNELPMKQIGCAGFKTLARGWRKWRQVSADRFCCLPGTGTATSSPFLHTSAENGMSAQVAPQLLQNFCISGSLSVLDNSDAFGLGPK